MLPEILPLNGFQVQVQKKKNKNAFLKNRKK